MDMLKIGTLRFKSKFPLALAPMAAVTTLPFRIQARQFGADMTFSEMADADGMYYNPDNHKRDFETAKGDHPVACQLFGTRPDTIAFAAKAAADAGADMIDINCGCPSFKLSRKGAGAKLLTQPSLIRELVESAVSAAGVPVTAKIRTGWDKTDGLIEVAHIIEDAGAAAITVHGRTAKMMYTGSADISLIRAVKESVKIPVIGNGDVVDGVSAKRMFDETGCDMVMIGRAAMGNPFVFSDVRAFLDKGINGTEHTKAERQKALLELWALSRELGYDDVNTLKVYCHWFSKGMVGGRRFREEVATKKSIAELEEIARESFC